MSPLVLFVVHSTFIGQRMLAQATPLLTVHAQLHWAGHGLYYSLPCRTLRCLPFQHCVFCFQIFRVKHAALRGLQLCHSGSWFYHYASHVFFFCICSELGCVQCLHMILRHDNIIQYTESKYYLHVSASSLCCISWTLRARSHCDDSSGIFIILMSSWNGFCTQLWWQRQRQRKMVTGGGINTVWATENKKDWFYLPLLN